MDINKLLSWLFPFTKLVYSVVPDDDPGPEPEPEPSPGDPKPEPEPEPEPEPKPPTIEELTTQISDLKKQIEDGEGKSQRVIDQLQKRLDTATWQRDNVKKGGERDWDDLSIEELKNYRVKARDIGNLEMVDFLTDKIAEKKTDVRVNKEAEYRESKYIRETTWKEALKEFPDLADESSEHHKETQAYVSRHKNFDNIMAFPDGHAEAARIVADRLKLKKLHNTDKTVAAKDKELLKERGKTSLGTTSSRPATKEGREQLDKLRDTAENSGSPYSKEWRVYFKALDDVEKKARENK